MPALLANHVANAKIYHDCRTSHACLVRTIKGQAGVTINGKAPVPAPIPGACDGKAALPGRPLDRAGHGTHSAFLTSS